MPKTVRVVFHQRLHHHWRSGFTGSHLSYTNHPKHQCQAIVKVPGSFRPAARNEHLYSYCNFTGPMVETVGKSLRHSCRSELTDRKSTRLNSSHVSTSYAVFCLKQKTRISVTVDCM